MRKEIYVCDGCGKTTDNYYDEKGWIIFEGVDSGICATITEGRKRDGTAKTKFHEPPYEEKLIFCCTRCLIKFLKNLTRGDEDAR